MEKRNSKGQFAKGTVSWNKDKKMLPQSRKPKSETHRKNISLARTGIHLSEITKNKLSKYFTGENNPAKRFEVRKKISALQQNIPITEWKQFVSREPYSQNFDNEFKKSIKERDNVTCLKCGLFEEDARKLFKKGLHTHHIDYNKQLTIKENCCALCVRCNIEVNTNRKSWTKFFQSLLAEKYGYKYSEEGEIILNILKEVNQHE